MEQLPWWIETKGFAHEEESKVSVKEIKRRVPITKVLEHYGWDGTSEVYHTGWYSIRCPFHNDSRNSASVNQTLGRFRCHGCDVGGDAIDLVSQGEHLSTREAMEWIQQRWL